MTTTGTVVIGAGQAGLALSRLLGAARHPHVVLERGRVGERWRSERWESLTLLTPNWLNLLPGSPAHRDAHGYLGRAELVAYLEDYAEEGGSPVVEGAEVVSVRRSAGGFAVDTALGTWHATSVVVATGDCDVPHVPTAAADLPPGVLGLHANGYRAPDAIPPGAVLVVGAGATGQQLALELARAGRDVTLAVGRHARAVRRYRGHDVFRWLAELGDLEQSLDDVADPVAARRAPPLPLSGAHGGERLDLAVLQRVGVGLTGRLEGFEGQRALFADDLSDSVADAERRLRRLLARVDAYLETADPTFPAEVVPPVAAPSGAPRSLDLRAAGTSTVIWATGYRRAYPWLRVPALGPDGELVHERGVTRVPGLYALGLRFQHRRSSHFIGGVGRDAAFLADRILTRSAALPERRAA